MFRRIAFLVLFLLLSVAYNGLTAPPAGNTEEAGIVPNVLVQTQIDLAMRAEGELDLCQQLIALKKSVNGDMEKLVRQILLYKIQHNDSEKLGWTFPILFDRLNIDHDQIFRAVISLVETHDERLRTEVLGLIGLSSTAENIQCIDFSSHEAFLASQKQNPPRLLVFHMIRTAPTEALSVMQRIYLDQQPKWRHLLWANHLVQITNWRLERGFAEEADIDAAFLELEKLSQFQEWWVRLYVVEILRHRPEFRRGDIIERLTKDPDQTVRDAFNPSFNQREIDDR